MIVLHDNNQGQLEELHTFSRSSVADLFPLADKSIRDLCQEDNLLVFPYSLADTSDRLADNHILDIINSADSEQVRLRTGNILGFIGRGKTRLKIQSRFDQGQDDYFLHYMLQQVFHFNLFDLAHSSQDEDLFDFLLFLFPRFLKAALRQGLFREYRTFRHNDAQVRGTVDVARHIRENLPFRGTIAYNTRQYSYDNALTQLVRHTIEHIRTRHYGQHILQADRDTQEAVALIEQVTPGYQARQRQQVIGQNLRPTVHPYFTQYRPLQRLCLQILQHEELKYGDSEKEIYGVLFDGAWLWEEYLNTLLEPLGFRHPQNKLGMGKIYLFEEYDEDGKAHHTGERYPDFYCDDIVLDAKYKRLGKIQHVSDVPREDIHQVITYMHSLGATRGGFIAPIEYGNEGRPKNPMLSAQLQGFGGTLSVYVLPIHQNCKSYAQFSAMIRVPEDYLKAAVNPRLV